MGVYLMKYRVLRRQISELAKSKGLRRQISELAKSKGLLVFWEEGSSHTKVSVGNRQTTIPRHSEVNEITSRAILRHLFGGE